MTEAKHVNGNGMEQLRLLCMEHFANFAISAKCNAMVEQLE
jgi:hypothetical protein